MSFSAGFNNTFRSLDNAFQWRASQKENARQFDATQAENVRVNDSRIDLNSAQIQRLSALTKLADQEVDFNGQMNPLRVENQELQNVGLGRLNENRRLANETAELQLRENEATSASRVKATNAQNRFTAFDSVTKEYEGRATNSKNLMLSLANEDGSLPTGQELASDPKAFTRAIAAMSASSEITDEGFGADSIALMKPQYDNGQLVGYIAMEESTPGGPLRVDPDAVDENGQPRIIPVEEAAGVYDALVAKLDQSASWGAKGGSARDRLVLGQADAQVRGGMDPRPSELPVPEAFQGRDVTEIEAEGQALQAELDRLESERKALEEKTTGKSTPRLGGIFSEGRLSVPTTLTDQEKAQLEQLNAREQEIKVQLGNIGAGLQALQQNATLGDRQSVWDTQLETGKRRLGDTVRRNEALSGANYTADQVRSLMSTGRSDLTPEQAQVDFAERVNDVADMVAKTAVGQHFNSKTGKWSKQDFAVAAQQMSAQLKSLASSNKTFAEMVKNPRYEGLVQKLGINAMALAGPGGTPNLQLAYQLFQENVETSNLGRIMQDTFGMINPKGEPMDPAIQAMVGRLVAEEMRANPNASPGAIAQRVKIQMSE